MRYLLLLFAAVSCFLICQFNVCDAAVQAKVAEFFYNQNWETADNPSGNPDYEILSTTLRTVVSILNDTSSAGGFIVSVIAPDGQVIATETKNVAAGASTNVSVLCTFDYNENVPLPITVKVFSSSGVVLVSRTFAQQGAGDINYYATKYIEQPDLYVIGEMEFNFPLNLPESPLTITAGWLDANYARQGNQVVATMAEQSVFYSDSLWIPAGNLAFETCDGEDLTVIPIWWATGPNSSDQQSQAFYFVTSSGFVRSEW